MTKEEAREFFNQNCDKMPTKEIAQTIGISQGLVYKWLKKIGKPTIRPFFEQYQQAEQYIIDNYQAMCIADLVKGTNTSRTFVTKIMQKHGLECKIKRDKIAVSEAAKTKQFLKENYAKYTIKELCTLTNSPHASICYWLNELGLKAKPFLNQKERIEKYIRENCATKSAMELALNTGNKLAWILDYLAKNGLSAKSTVRTFKEPTTLRTNKKWTPEDDAFLLENYKNLKYREIADVLNRTKESIKTRIVKTFGWSKQVQNHHPKL
jgi:transposase